MALSSWQRGAVLTLCAQLREAFGPAAAKCTHAAFCDWSERPHVHCGYTAPTGTARQRLELGRPEGRVFFAGEATSVTLDVSLEGAMETGRRSARAIVDKLKGKRGGGGGGGAEFM